MSSAKYVLGVQTCFGLETYLVTFENSEKLDSENLTLLSNNTKIRYPKLVETPCKPSVSLLKCDPCVFFAATN